MPAADDAPDGLPHGPHDQLRHDLKSPLTTIYARAQLLDRAIQRSPALTDEERTWMLARISAIERAVREMVTVIDGIGNEDRGS